MAPRKTRAGFPARLIRSDSGASMVEFTLMITFLLTLAFGIFEFGRYMYSQHLVTAGVRDGARYLARMPDPTLAANQTAAKNIAVFGNATGTGTARVSYWAASDVAIPNPLTSIVNDDGSGNPLYRGGATITIIELSTAVAYPDLGMLNFIGVGSLMIRASHQERHIGD